MLKILEWMKKHKILTSLLIAVFVFGIPLGIHACFKKDALSAFWIAEWSAGDVLQYYASIIIGVATIILAGVSVWQTKEANNLSQQMLKTEEASKMSFVKIDLEKSKVSQFTVEGVEELTVSLCFENLTSIPISILNLSVSNTNLYDDFLRPEEDDIRMRIPKNIRFILNFDENGSVDTITRQIKFEKADIDVAYLLLIETDITNILGFESHQVYSIAITPMPTDIEQYCIAAYRAKAL